MLTLCSEICQSKNDSSISAGDSKSEPAMDAQRKPGIHTTGLHSAVVTKPRESESKRPKRPSAGAADGSPNALSPERLAQVGGAGSGQAELSPERLALLANSGPVAVAQLNGSGAVANGASVPNGPAGAAGGPGPFGVMRQPSATSVLQNALKIEVKTRNEELLRVQREDEQRTNLVVTLEQEVFEKERYLADLKAGMQKLGISGLDGAPSEGSAPCPQSLAAKERERLQQEMRNREGEAADLRQRVGALEELIREKRAEVVSKGEATLQLLFQLSSTGAQQRIAENPLMQAAPGVVNDA